MLENKTKIIITRKSEWMNRLRSYQILIDGAEAGSIKNGSSEEFVVAPGEHSAQCKLNWFYSPAFKVNLSQNEIEYLRIRSALRGWIYILLIAVLALTILVNFYYKEDLHTKPSWLLWLQVIVLIPFFAYSLYSLTIGRKKYFVIEKDINNIFTN